LNVLYHRAVEDYLFELIETLYKEEYFGFYESAIEYVNWLKFEIELSIDNCPKKKASEYFNRFKENLSYISLNKNSNTTWYVFFLCDNNAYYIYYIGNNHNIGQYL